MSVCLPCFRHELVFTSSHEAHIGSPFYRQLTEVEMPQPN